MAELIWGVLTTKWPKPRTSERDRRKAPWYVHDGRAEKKVLYELDQLNVRDARAELDAAPADFSKTTGRLYKDSRLRSPGVLLVFHLPEVGEVQYACDQYLTWTQNLHAIGMTLERLRLVDSYSATVAGARQQYRGFKRLGSGGEDVSTEEALEPMEAAAIVLRHALNDPIPNVVNMLRELVLADAEQMRLYVRKAERNTHPDSGGNANNFAMVQRCKAVLQTHHGSSQEAANV